MATIAQTFAENILAAATISGTAPSTGYSLTTLGQHNPAKRVRWGSGTVTATFTIGSARGDVLCLPMHNLSGSVLSVTNGAGLNVAITIPTARANGFPETLVADLTVLEPNAATRTSTAWNLVITSNPSNVILGGAVAIYGPKREMNRAVEWGLTERESQLVIDHQNLYGTSMTYDLQAMSRWVDCQVIATDSQRSELLAWYRAGHGSVRPSLLWLDSADTTSAYYGVWAEAFSAQRTFRHVNPVTITFRELGKGVSLV